MLVGDTGERADHGASRSGLPHRKRWGETREEPGDTPQHLVDGASDDGLELGPTEKPQATVQKERVKPCMKVPDGGIRDISTNHSLGYSGALRMLQPGMNFQEVRSLCPWEWQSSSWLSPTPASDSPALVQQRILLLSPEVVLALGGLAATTAHLYGGSSLPKPKLGHSCSSQAIRVGSSSVKLQSLA